MNNTFIKIIGDLKMNKKRIALASTLAVLLAPTVLGTISGQTTVQADPIVMSGDTINNPVGTVDYGGTYAFDGNGNKTSLFLSGKSSWKLGKEITINNQKYYEIGSNEYVSLQNITVTDGVPKALPFLIKDTAASQTGTLKYAVKVINQYGEPSGRILSAGSSWKLNNLYFINGNTYYKVSTYEYVPADSIRLNPINSATTNQSTTNSTTKKVGTVISTAHVINSAGSSFGLTLPVGSSWQLGPSVMIGDTYYYLVGTNEYIPVSSVHVNGTHAVDKPSNPGTTGTAHPVNTVIKLYNASTILDDNGNDTGRILPAGSSWRADRTKTMHNYVYYRVATNEWVTDGDYYGSTDIFFNGPANVTLNKDVQLYDTSSNSMTRTLTKGSSWKVDRSVQNINGQFFVRVSSNEWIRLERGTFVDYSDSNNSYNGFAYSATYEPNFATNIN